MIATKIELTRGARKKQHSKCKQNANFHVSSHLQYAIFKLSKPCHEINEFQGMALMYGGGFTLNRIKCLPAPFMSSYTVDQINR